MKQRVISFSFKDTPVKAGEYGAGFGHGNKPIMIIKIYLFIGKHMSVTEETDTFICLVYAGVLPKRTRDGLNYMQRTGLIQNFRERERSTCEYHGCTIQADIEYMFTSGMHGSYCNQHASIFNRETIIETIYLAPREQERNQEIGAKIQ